MAVAAHSHILVLPGARAQSTRRASTLREGGVFTRQYAAFYAIHSIHPVYAEVSFPTGQPAGRFERALGLPFRQVILIPEHPEKGPANDGCPDGPDA
eukprot:1196169-Prorocentrum_minimum.AAC.4